MTKKQKQIHVKEKLAASKGNLRMKKRVNSGKPRTGNPEPSH